VDVVAAAVVVAAVAVVVGVAGALVTECDEVPPHADSDAAATAMIATLRTIRRRLSRLDSPARGKLRGVSSVRLCFLGCGDAFASGGRFQTCFHLHGGGEPLLIDCGATALIALKRQGIDPASIGWVVLSHLHGDHFAGLPWLILDGQFAKRERPLMIAGPPETQERFLRAFEALYPAAPDAERPFEVRVVELAEREPHGLGPAQITPFEVKHGGGSTPYALRIEYGGKTISYSGDTEWTDSLIEVARGADLFICECNYLDKRVPGHLDYRTLEAKRDQLDCGRLILTHMAEDMLARVGELGVEAAADGMVVEL
jgi:ribonuclease BN (tRNA processing enzyme)